MAFVWKEENEAPGWTQLKLPGQAPSPRCGHTITSGGHYLLLFGGHGTGGWLSRYDIYHNDCVVLDRVSVQWKRLPTNNESPAARAYHTMTSMGSRYLLFGGFDGKLTYGDLWWLVPEGDPIAQRMEPSMPEDIIESRGVTMEDNSIQSSVKGSKMEDSAFSELQKKLEISFSISSPELQIIDESEDPEFLELSSQLNGGVDTHGPISRSQAAQALRDHWRKAEPKSIPLKELGPLLRDYQRLISRHYIAKIGSTLQDVESGFTGRDAYRLYHMKKASQLRMDDVPILLEEYRQIPSEVGTL